MLHSSRPSTPIWQSGRGDTNPRAPHLSSSHDPFRQYRSAQGALLGPAAPFTSAVYGCVGRSRSTTRPMDHRRCSDRPSYHDDFLYIMDCPLSCNCLLPAKEDLHGSIGNPSLSNRAQHLARHPPKPPGPPLHRQRRCSRLSSQRLQSTTRQLCLSR